MTLPVELEKSEVAKVSKTKLAVSEGIPYITQKTGERYYKYGIHITTSDPTFTWKRSTVYRRYSEFCWLRKNLKDTSYMFLATVPDLPGQGLFRNRNDLKFIEERRFGLEKFLLQVLSVNVFTSNRGLHLFLQTSLSIEDIKYNMKGSRHDHVILIKKCIPVLDKSQSESVAVSLENESFSDQISDMVNVAIIGCGLLGTKIAGELAYHGHCVKVYDNNPKALQSVFTRLQQDKAELKEAGILKQQTFIGSVSCLSHLHEAVANVEFIFEAVKEDLVVKQEILERISHCCPEDAIIATNTMRLDIKKLTSRTSKPQRAIGIRFLFPVYCIPEVEVTLGPETDIKTLMKVQDLLSRMGKTIFFRSGPEPLVLNKTQREIRIMARREQVEFNKHLGGRWNYVVPELAHCGNFAPAADGQTGTRPDIQKECSICMNHIRDCIFHPCHHVCTCVDCGRLLASRRDCCPICRTSIMEVIRIFHS
ncbi:hypothetical protein CHUAL_001949 [Chamberlinius hualienensis]